MPQIRIRAVGDLLCPLVAPDGATLKGRYAGRDKTGSALPDGELVDESSYYVRAVSRGDLLAVSDAPVAPETPVVRTKAVH